MEVPGINAVSRTVKTLVEELTATEDEMQWQSRRCRGRPSICIRESELCNLLELRFTQVEITIYLVAQPELCEDESWSMGYRK